MEMGISSVLVGVVMDFGHWGVRLVFGWRSGCGRLRGRGGGREVLWFDWEGRRFGCADVAVTITVAMPCHGLRDWETGNTLCR